MTAKGRSKLKTVPTKSDAAIKRMNNKTKVKPKAGATKPKVKKRGLLKSDKMLPKVQKDLKFIQAKVEHQTQLMRLSFVVRLMMDKDGRPQRTEIEQVESSRKQSFLGLDGEGLVDFMKASIDPTFISEVIIPAVPSPQKASVLTPWPMRSKYKLIITSIQVFDKGKPDLMTFILTSQESFILQARFQLKGPDATFVTIQQPSYEMNIYANDLTSGKSRWLTTYSGTLIQNVFEYVATAEVPGLSPGFYHLFTVIALSTPNRVGDFYSNTIAQVL